MKNKWCVNVVFLFFLVGICVCACTQDSNSSNNSRWSEEKIQEWYDNQPWLVGCNYIPATAINQIEMWSAVTFDSEQIDKELSWAHELGFNTLRVFLSSVVWQNDATGMKKRVDEFLNICRKYSIRPMFVFFDDCWNPESALQRSAPRSVKKEKNRSITFLRFEKLGKRIFFCFMFFLTGVIRSIPFNSSLSCSD